MKINKAIATTLFVSFALIQSPALASGDGDVGCTSAPQSEWRTTDDVKAAAEALGYKVRRVKVEDGCYEAYALDQDGKRVEVYFHPETLAVVRVKGQS